MKSLHLLRHAKSSWKVPGLNDHDRPLSKRGRQTAKMMAAYLRRAKIAPDLVICSTATRAQQTLDPIVKAKKPPKVVLEREIYGGAQRALWEQLRPDDENARCRVSRVRVQPKNFSQPTQPLTTLSTSNAISPPQKRTEPSGPRRCRRGATSSLRREPNMPADLLRALFGNVTVPQAPHSGQRAFFWMASIRDDFGIFLQ